MQKTVKIKVNMDLLVTEKEDRVQMWLDGHYERIPSLIEKIFEDNSDECFKLENISTEIID